MPNTLDMLHQDHAGMAELLKLFAKQVEAMRLAEVEPDYHLMYEIVDYFVRFADVLHHPCEDRLYALLSSRRHSLDRVLDGLAAEHTMLGELGRDLRTRLKAAQAGQLTSRPRLVEVCIDFLQIQRRHMELEERHLFPAVADFLGEADLAEVAEASGRDPNIAEPGWLASGFEKIRAALVEEATQHRAAAE